MTLCSATRGLGDLAKRDPMHNLAVSQTRMFSVWNLRYSPTARHFAQPGRVATVGLVCLVQRRTALRGLIHQTPQVALPGRMGTTQRHHRLATRETA